MSRLKTVMAVIASVVLTLFDLTTIIVTFLGILGIITMTAGQTGAMAGMWIVAFGATMFAGMALYEEW